MAQVDSSVGGKTGVNHPLGKNMVGAFYQPTAVLIDTATLRSLPDRELASGISEIVKYGLIRDAPLFEWLEANMQRLLDRDPEVRPGRPMGPYRRAVPPRPVMASGRQAGRQGSDASPCHAGASVGHAGHSAALGTTLLR